MDLATVKTLNPRQFHTRRTARRRAEREALRLGTLERARGAILRRAPEHPAVREVHLFGSILPPECFHLDSDIDVAVICDDIEAEAPFARALEQDLDRPVDLRPLAGPIAETIRFEGEKVYG